MREIIRLNLVKLMSLSKDCKSANALAKKSHVGQTTISNYLRDNYIGYPKLEHIEKIAHCFGMETWQLIHPIMGDKEIKAKEIELYRKLKEDLMQLQNQ